MKACDIVFTFNAVGFTWLIVGWSDALKNNETDWPRSVDVDILIL